MIRLAAPSIEEDDLQAVREALASGMLVQGARVGEFEEQLKSVTGTRHTVAVSNGTAALHLAMLALDVKQGDLVVVTAYSWISTANAVEFCGAQPVFVDIDRQTFNMDPAALASTLDRLMKSRETAGRVKAVLPIDAFGQMSDLAAIREIAGRYGIPVVEDAACALGARLRDKPAGSWTKLATFSFHPRKAITTGEGGFIATDDDKIAWRLRALRNHGQDPDSAIPDFVMPGFNYRMTEFQAALGVTQLGKLNRIIKRRRELAATYDRLLSGTPLQTPFVPPDNEPVFQSYVCLLPEAVAPRRAGLIGKLRTEGVETTIGTWHMPLATFYRRRYGYKPGDFPATDDIFAQALSLPMSEGLTTNDQGRVIKTLTHVLQG
jgi:perosamine synthetase